MKKSSLLFLLTGYALIAFSQQNKTPASREPLFAGSVEGVSEYRLANGLQVLLVPDMGVSNVIVNVVYHVGSRHEGYGETGMAHLLEHMMFKGSAKFKSIKQTIADKGASANGTTWYDRTDYFEILPATDSNLRWALDMESDRMVNSLMRDEDLKKEFSVVRNEFEADENEPSDILSERIISTMYLWHNYGKSTIGSKEDIERVPISSLAAFYRKYYQPDNATLIVGGNFDSKTALQLITAYFGRIKKPSRILQQPYTVEPPQDGERYVELTRNGDMQYAAIAYHTPSFADPDYAANAAVVNILSNDPSGIFYKALVESKLATKVSGTSYTLYDPGFSYYGVDIPVGKSLDSAKDALLRSANSLPTVNISQDDLDRAKNSILKDLDNSQNNSINFCIDEAEYIGAGDWRLFYLFRDRVKQVKLEDVQRILKKYYVPSNRTAGVFIPDKNAEITRAKIAERPDIRDLLAHYKGNSTQAQTVSFVTSIPNIKSNTEYGRLSNGMKYALLKKPARGDKIYSKLTLRIGDEQSLMGKSMIPELTARMLKKGTTTRSKKDINDLLDKLKTTIDIEGDADKVNITINTDRTNLAAALDLLGDILLHPAFDKGETEKTLEEMKGELEAQHSDPQSVAYLALLQKTILYPREHPLYPENIVEMLEDLKKVSSADLPKFYQDFYGMNNASVSFVGNIDPQTIKTFLENRFGSFNSKQPFAEIPEKHFDVAGSTEYINITDKTNAVCYGRINIALKQTDPDYVKLDMADQMLGGGTFLSSRISNSLRETEGMSYGAGSVLRWEYKYPASYWLLYAIFNPKYKTRLDSAIRGEIRKALTGGFGEVEFRKSLNSWLQDRKTQLGQDDVLAGLLTSYMDQGKDLNFFSDYETRAKAVTLSQVNEALRKYISPEKTVFVYAGDFRGK